MINALITELWLPRYGPKLRLWRHVKFGILKPPFKVHFKSYSYQWLNVIRPTKVPNFIMIKLILWKLWQCKFGSKCQFFRFLEVIFTLNFYPDYRFQIQTFQCSAITHSHSLRRYLELCRSWSVLVWPLIRSPLLLFLGNIAYL